MKQNKNNHIVGHQEGYEWCNCPKCGEKISLIKREKGNRKSTILVVDDEIGIRNLIEAAFDPEEYEVLTSSSAEEALGVIKTHRPDLVLLDIRLPGMNGIEALKEIKKIDETIVVIMITAFGDEKDAFRCMRLGAAAYVNKPFDVNYITMLVQNYL